MGFYQALCVMMGGSLLFIVLGFVTSTKSVTQSKEFFLMGSIGFVCTVIFLVGFSLWSLWKMYSGFKSSNEQKEEIIDKINTLN